MRKTNQAVSIIVPTLNEADNISLLFERIDSALAKASIEYEIIVVDDHSADATAAIVENADQKYHAKLLVKQGKAGKARSLLEGFDAAKYDLICMIDADLQYPPEAIPRMYHKMQYCDADIIITNRIENKTSLARKLSSGAFHAVFTRALFGINYDTQSGLKLFKKHTLENIEISPSPWTFDLEFIVRSLEKKYVIMSEDILFSERHAGVTKLNLVEAAFEGAWQSLKLRRATSVRRVRSHYRDLQPLQRSFNWLAVLVFSVLLMAGVQTTSVSAAQSPTSTNPLQNIIEDLLPITTTQPSTGNSAPSSNPVTSTPATTTPATATTSMTSSNMAQSTTTSPATANQAPSSSTIYVKPASSTPTNASVANSSVATTGSAVTDSGKDVPYYPESKLSSSRTNTLLNIAQLTFKIGGVLLAVGLLLFGVRALIQRSGTQQSRRRQEILGA